jgi:hypothetical protein
VIDLERRRDGRHDALHDAVRSALVVPFGHEKHELVAPGARDGIAVADARQQAFAGDLQKAVADVVAEAVVDQLEVVEVDEGDAEGPLVAMCDAAAGAADPSAVAIGESGGVVICLVLSRPDGANR